jgi:hypothetical protein
MPQTPEDSEDVRERPGDHDHLQANVKQNNAEAQPSREDRLVEIGRAYDTKGRGSQKG